MDQEAFRAERFAIARQGAERLYREGARRVVLFGSLARGRRQDEMSDIDLAVEGLPPELFYRMIAELNEELLAPIDLVELERASATLLGQIALYGVELAP